MKNLNVGTRIAAGFALVLALMIAVALIGSWAVDSQYQQVKTLVEGDLAMHDAINNIRYNAGNLRRFEKDCFINLDKADKIKEYREKWSDSLDKARTSLKVAKDLADKDIGAQLTKLSDELDKYAAGFGNVAGQLGQGLGTTADANKAMGEYKPAIHAMEETLNDLL